MNINSMVSVKDAAALLGCDKKYVREKLEQGQLKGEKRLDGGKEKWFVQKKAVEEELAKMPIVTPTGTYQLGADGRAQVATEAVVESVEVTARRRRRNTRATRADNDLFFGIDVETVDVPVVEDVPVQRVVNQSSEVLKSIIQTSADHPKGLTFERTQARESMKNFRPDGQIEFEDYFEEPSAESVPAVDPNQPLLNVVQAMVKEFSKRLEAYRQVNTLLALELEDKSMQLRLLPDLQKKAAEVYRLEFEGQALKKQIACMESQHFDTLVLLQKAEEEAIPQLQSRLEEEYRMHSIEVARLREQLHQYSVRLQQAEIEQSTVGQLESALHDVIEQKEMMLRLAQAEIDRARKERDAEFRKLTLDAERVWKGKEQELRKIAAEAERIKLENEELARVAQEAERQKLESAMEIERIHLEAAQLLRAKDAQLEEAARIKREKEFELELLADETDLITQEKRIALANLDERLSQIALQEQNIAKLEIALRETSERKELETQLANAEAERVSSEMSKEIESLNERISKITVQLEAAKTPWWRRWFLPA
jgi:hypothetical protein